MNDQVKTEHPDEVHISPSELNTGLGLHTCQECGMQTEIAAYHPYAACLMFKACHNSETVQANLHSVVAHGYQAAYEAMTPEILMPNAELRPTPKAVAP